MVPDDENKPRENGVGQQIEQFVDGKFMNIYMTLLTLFALWGDDFRLAFTDSDFDFWMQLMWFLALVCFLGEFFANSIVKDQYKYSFFFWLDGIASLSIVPDIQIFMAFFSLLMNSGEAGVGGAAKSARTARTARLARLARLVRLVRIVKLYSIISKANDAEQEERLKAQARAAQNAKQAALKRVEASRLGKVLSEKTTTKVIMGVLLMLSILPNLAVLTVDLSKSYGLKMLYHFGTSNCPAAEGVEAIYESRTDDDFAPARRAEDVEPVDCPLPQWASDEGWATMAYLFTQVSKDPTATPSLNGTAPNTLQHPLLWLHVPSRDHAGKAVTIPCISNEDPDCVHTPVATAPWYADPKCQGYPRPASCKLRDIEVTDIVYIPWECQLEGASCDGVAAWARFDTSQDSRDGAIRNIILTCFVCVLLSTLSVQFQNDTQRLVIAPIEKMVNIIKQLAEDPLQQPDMGGFDEEAPGGTKERKGRKGAGPQLETSMLENTILKIGKLLQVGFGSSGADIIGKNMSSGDGELNIMMPGHMVNAIFGFTDIRDFTGITECLEGDIMLFINTVGKIVQSCVHHWDGVSNKNIGDAFLVIWKADLQRGSRGPAANKASAQDEVKISQLADRALMSFVKIHAEVTRSQELVEFGHKNEAIMTKYEHWEMECGLALHMGWAIEGPIGSDFKVDASYLSHHVNLCMFIESATKAYKIRIILTEKFYTLLSLRAKERCRRIDHVKVGEMETGLYTFNMNEFATPLPAPTTGHKLGQLLRPDALEEIPVETLEREGAEFLFVADKDVANLQDGIPEQLNADYREGLCYVGEGDWEKAYEVFSKIETYWADGPTYAQKRFIEILGDGGRHAPHNWNGYHELSDSIVGEVGDATGCYSSLRCPLAEKEIRQRVTTVAMFTQSPLTAGLSRKSRIGAAQSVAGALVDRKSTRP